MLGKVQDACHCLFSDLFPTLALLCSRPQGLAHRLFPCGTPASWLTAGFSQCLHWGSLEREGREKPKQAFFVPPALFPPGGWLQHSGLPSLSLQAQAPFSS